jgi:hypothetical protein
VRVLVEVPANVVVRVFCIYYGELYSSHLEMFAYAEVLGGSWQ